MGCLYVSGDMSRAYRVGAEECFPKAKQTIDKFHIKKLLNDTLDEVRRQEQKEQKSKELNVSRKLLMIPESKMAEQQQERLTQISKAYPKTGWAYRIVAALDIYYRSANLEEARARFGQLISWMKRSRLEPMKKTAKRWKVTEKKSSIISSLV